MKSVRGLLWAALSSSTFGLAPLFTLLLLGRGYSPFEVLSYRWGIATLALTLFGFAVGCDFRLARRDWGAVLLLSLLRAATSFCLVIAYANIASGVASTIHFMYPLAVALAMMCFFGERRSASLLAAVAISIAGAVLLSLGTDERACGGNFGLGLLAASLSVFTYGAYIVGVRKTRAAALDSTVLTCYVMGLGALFFLVGGSFAGGVRLECDGWAWMWILGLALPATAVSNMALVKAIGQIGPTLTAIFGALEPLTAVVIGIAVFGEPFTPAGAVGMLLIVAAVTLVVFRRK